MYTSKSIITWAKKKDLSLITLPSVSLDFLILESIAHPLKRQFHTKQYTTEKASLARFTQIFKKEMDQKSIQYIYNKYTKRLHDYRRAGGQMIKY